MKLRWNKKADWLTVSSLRWVTYARRTLMVVVALLLVYGVGSWLLLPSYLRTNISEQVQKNLGRKLDIGEVRFAPFALSVTMNDLVLYEADQPVPAVKVKSAVVNLSLASLFRQALVMDELRIEQPEIQLVRIFGDSVTSSNGTSSKLAGRYNFSDILTRFNSTPKSANPLQFALANIQVKNGAITFQDQVLKKQTRLDQIQIGVPFLSNFPTAVESDVQPALSARINGANFALKGRSKPFVDSLDTSLAIDIHAIELADYVEYLPQALPVKLQTAHLSTKLDLTFSKKNQQAEVLLSGDVNLDHVQVSDHAEQPLIKLDTLRLKIKKINLQSVELEKLSVSKPELWLDIDQQGQLNWQSLWQGEEKTAQIAKPANLTTQTKSGEHSQPANNAGSNPVALQIGELVVSEGMLHVNDAHYARPAQQTNLHDIEVKLHRFSTLNKANDASFSLNATLGEAQKAHLEGAFNIPNSAAKATLSLTDFQLTSLQAYMNPYLAARVRGDLTMQMGVDIQKEALKIHDLSLQANHGGLQSKEKNQGGVVFSSLSLKQAEIDLSKRVVELNGIQLQGMQAELMRDQQARWNWQKMLGLPGTAAQPAVQGTQINQIADGVRDTNATHVADNIGNNEKKANKLQSNWQILVRDFSTSDASVSLTDASVTPAATFKADALSLKLDQFASDLSKPVLLELSAQLGPQGKLRMSMNSTPQLRKISMTLDAKALPVSVLSPYFSSLLNIELHRGVANFKGQLVLNNLLAKEALQSTYDGNLSLNDFQFAQANTTDDFLQWKSIALDGINLKWGGENPSITLSKLSLNDFYTKLILSEKGVLNIKNVTSKDEQASGTQKKAAAQTAPVAQENADANGKLAGSADAVKTPSKMHIRIGETLITGGNINFTDNFIKPNYVANLTGVSGRIGALDSNGAQSASIELVGKIDNDAPLQISGSLNPVSVPVRLDIKGSASDIELTRLTPYAAKYAGYGIEKGKLSMQVSYRLEGDQLQAQNNLVLDQLTFGERIDNPDATSLPVLLAVALLKDNKGQIAINLPVSGSLSDPQFSIGGVIFKVFVNLITKAVTAPFALLGSLFGGGEELAYIEFLPGSEMLTPAAKSKLESLANALKNRAGLKLDITGRIDPVSDVDGLKLGILDDKIRSFKWRDLAKSQTQIKLEEVGVDEADRKKYIEAVYQAEKFTKPRNVIGLAKTLPPDEAKALLLANIAVTEAHLLQLAQRRADIVRDYLQMQQNITPERLFLIAPKLKADDIKDHGAARRVDFSLK